VRTEVSPAVVTLQPGGRGSFQATGFDAQGAEPPLVNVQWSAASSNHPPLAQNAQYSTFNQYSRQDAIAGTLIEGQVQPSCKSEVACRNSCSGFVLLQDPDTARWHRNSSAAAAGPIRVSF
jgi:surface antigen